MLLLWQVFLSFFFKVINFLLLWASLALLGFSLLA